MPPATRSWQVGLPSYAGARTFLAALLDSPLQPDRAALLDAAGLRRAGLTPDPIALLLSIGSVAEAVEQPGQALEALASGHGGWALDVEPAATARVAICPAHVTPHRLCPAAVMSERQ